MHLARTFCMVAALCAAAPVALAQDATPATRTRNGGYLGIFLREKGDTVTIERVHPGSMAEKAGFKAGDVILEVNGAKLANGDALVKRFWSRRPLTVTVRRGDETVDVRTTTRDLDTLPKVGDKAPDFTLKARDGKGTHALKELLARGQPVVLVFGSFT